MKGLHQKSHYQLIIFEAKIKYWLLWFSSIHPCSVFSSNWKKLHATFIFSHIYWAKKEFAYFIRKSWYQKPAILLSSEFTFLIRIIIISVICNNFVSTLFSEPFFSLWSLDVLYSLCKSAMQIYAQIYL